MNSLLTTLPLTAVIAFITSLGGVAFADWIGFRRDRERLRLEFDWKYREKRADALLGLLSKRPYFSLENGEAIINSVSKFTIWVEYEVEPWLGEDSVNAVRLKRQPVSEWIEKTISVNYETPGSFQHEVPSRAINELQAQTIIEIKNALSELNSDTLAVANKSAW